MNVGVTFHREEQRIQEQYRSHLTNVQGPWRAFRTWVTIPALWMSTGDASASLRRWLLRIGAARRVFAARRDRVAVRVLFSFRQSSGGQSRQEEAAGPQSYAPHKRPCTRATLVLISSAALKSRFAFVTAGASEITITNQQGGARGGFLISSQSSRRHVSTTCHNEANKSRTFSPTSVASNARTRHREPAERLHIFSNIHPF